MYKLVVVAGKLRGKEFELEEGENIVGRDAGCSVQLAVNGISKRHMSITVTDDVAYLEDLGSSNGTFLNGKICKRATIKGGDKIALPDTILSVVHVKEKKIIIKKKAAKGDDEDIAPDYLTGGTMPSALPDKIKYIFKYRIMKPLYGINEEYEWRVLIGIALTLFITICVFLTINPVLRGSANLLRREVALRGLHYADEIARINNKALERKNLDRLDTAFLKKEPGIVSYELFDMDGRIVRPMSKLNKYISDTFSIKAKEWASNSKARGKYYTQNLDDGVVGIASKIEAYNARSGLSETVGVIAIHFAPKSLAIETARNSKAFLEALTTSAIVAVFFFGLIYYLTLRPIEEMKFQIEEALRGKRKGVDPKHLFGELATLKNAINTALQRVRELSNEGGDEEFEEAEDSAGYVMHLAEFMQGAGVPVMILDSEKNVHRINPEAEDVTGIRETGSEGQNIMDVSREKGFSGTIIELCDNCANNQGTSQEGSYELQGHDYKIYVTGLVGKDSFVKAFYITFIKDD